MTFEEIARHAEKIGFQFRCEEAAGLVVLLAKACSAQQREIEQLKTEIIELRGTQ